MIRFGLRIRLLESQSRPLSIPHPPKPLIPSDLFKIQEKQRNPDSQGVTEKRTVNYVSHAVGFDTVRDQKGKHSSVLI